MITDLKYQTENGQAQLLMVSLTPQNWRERFRMAWYVLWNGKIGWVREGSQTLDLSSRGGQVESGSRTSSARSYLSLVKTPTEEMSLSPPSSGGENPAGG